MDITMQPEFKLSKGLDILIPLSTFFDPNFFILLGFVCH